MSRCIKRHCISAEAVKSKTWDGRAPTQAWARNEALFSGGGSGKTAKFVLPPDSEAGSDPERAVLAARPRPLPHGFERALELVGPGRLVDTGLALGAVTERAEVPATPIVGHEG